MDWRGAVILVLSFGVPLLLLLQRRERELLGWLCISVGVNIFDARVGINLPAARIVGLLVLPFLPLGELQFQRLLRTRPFRILLLGFLYLAILGLTYGFLYPWADEGFLRPFVQSGPGRVLIYSVRVLADLGITLFVARRIMRGTLPHELIQWVLVGTTIAMVGGVLEYATQMQLYQGLTGYPIQEVANRVRGFNFEPRGLGLTMVHGSFIAFLWSRYRRSRLLLALAAAHLVVLVLAVSASALIAAAFGWLCLVVFEPKARRPLLGAGVLTTVLLVVALGIGKELTVTQAWTTNLTSRFTLGEATDLVTHTPLEVIALFLDIFDYTAYMVLVSSPLAALIGVGPGLVMLPGSAFIPTDGRWGWVVSANEGITSLPTMGILLEWANGGVLMVLLWLAFAVTCWRALTRLAALDPAHADSWRLGRGAFVVVAGTYLVQASPISAIWPIFMGLGIGAAALALDRAPIEPSPAPIALQGI